jgi:hypothetical protein
VDQTGSDIHACHAGISLVTLRDTRRWCRATCR